MTTLFIRYPAKASIDSGAAPTCAFALVGDGGNLQQQGEAPLGNLADMVAAARRVTLLLAASDVTLLRVKTPPLSAARLKAALPALVEEQILGDTADCVLAAGAADADGLRTVAVVQRAWLEVLVKALVAQGAHSVAVVPAQLCLPFQPGAVAASLQATDAGYELTLRHSQFDGMGLVLPAEPQGALQTLRALAGDEPATLYLAPAQLREFEALLAAEAASQQQLQQAHGSHALHGHVVTLAEDHWAHRVAAARAAGLDLAPALGALAGAGAARAWQRWRWPLRIAALALLVNVIGLNVEWLRLKREAAAVQQQMTQIFRAAYPKDPISADVAGDMRIKVGRARGQDGQAAPDSFLALTADLGEALAGLPRRDVIASLDYRERALQVKVKPNTVDAAAMTQLRAALSARHLELTENTPGTWQIRRSSDKSKV